MSFLLHCPTCGERSVYEFQFGGKVRARPAIEAPREAWVGYVYWRDNSPGMQKEWWYHKLGCKLWFIAERNTTSNQVLRSYFAELESRGEKT